MGSDEEKYSQVYDLGYQAGYDQGHEAGWSEGFDSEITTSRAYADSIQAACDEQLDACAKMFRRIFTMTHGSKYDNHDGLILLMRHFDSKIEETLDLDELFQNVYDT